MIVKQTAIFQRRVKKMHSQEKKELDKVIKDIITTPSLGQVKKVIYQVFKFTNIKLMRSNT